MCENAIWEIISKMHEFIFVLVNYIKNIETNKKVETNDNNAKPSWCFNGTGLSVLTLK